MDYKHCYEPAGNIVTGDLKIITDSRVQSILCNIKGLNTDSFTNRLTSTNFVKKLLVPYNIFFNRWCKREHVESYALNTWNFIFFADSRISFYCKTLNLLPSTNVIEYDQVIPQSHTADPSTLPRGRVTEY